MNIGFLCSLYIWYYSARLWFSSLLLIYDAVLNWSLYIASCVTKQDFDIVYCMWSSGFVPMLYAERWCILCYYIIYKEQIYICCCCCCCWTPHVGTVAMHSVVAMVVTYQVTTFITQWMFSQQRHFSSDQKECFYDKLSHDVRNCPRLYSHCKCLLNHVARLCDLVPLGNLRQMLRRTQSTFLKLSSYDDTSVLLVYRW